MDLTQTFMIINSSVNDIYYFNISKVPTLYSAIGPYRYYHNHTDVDHLIQERAQKYKQPKHVKLNAIRIQKFRIQKFNMQLIFFRL